MRTVRKMRKHTSKVRRQGGLAREEFAPRRLNTGEPTRDTLPDWLPEWAGHVYNENARKAHDDSYGLLVHEAKVIGRHGWIQAKGGIIVDDLWSWKGYPALRFDESLEEYARTTSHSLQGTTAVLACPWAGNYWHFSFQALPRVLLAQEYAQKYEIDHWIIQKSKAAFVTELLGYAGVVSSSVVQLWSDSAECEKVIGTTVPSADVYVPRWVADYLRGIVPRIESANGAERLFVIRGTVGGRDISNHRALVSYLKDEGFLEITMDGRSVAEQAAIFRAAKVVVAVHGAALTNLVYCEPDTLVVELTSVNYAWPAYHRLATTMDLRYFQVLGLELRQPRWMYELQQGADMVADLDSVKRILTLHGSKGGTL